MTDIAQKLAELLNDGVLVAHDVGFDSRFLLAEPARAPVLASQDLDTPLHHELPHVHLPASGRAIVVAYANRRYQRPHPLDPRPRLSLVPSPIRSNGSQEVKLHEDLRPLVKSRQRVADHGEVFTPRWLVDDMLDLVKDETERIDSRFLEPACGSGNFLVPILERKLRVVETRYGKSDFERRHYGLFGLMCVYGVELLPDNSVECRDNLASAFARILKLGPDDGLLAAARAVLAVNIVQGDALAMTDGSGAPIVFPEWGYLGRGKFQRRDFRFDALTQRSAASGTLFDAFEEHEIFTPTQSYPPMSVDQIAMGSAT